MNATSKQAFKAFLTQSVVLDKPPQNPWTIKNHMN
jgi:hypothetical protein